MKIPTGTVSRSCAGTCTPALLASQSAGFYITMDNYTGITFNWSSPNANQVSYYGVNGDNQLSIDSGNFAGKNSITISLTITDTIHSVTGQINQTYDIASPPSCSNTLCINVTGYSTTLLQEFVSVQVTGVTAQKGQTIVGYKWSKLNVTDPFNIQTSSLGDPTPSSSFTFTNLGPGVWKFKADVIDSRGATLSLLTPNSYTVAIGSRRRSLAAGAAVCAGNATTLNAVLVSASANNTASASVDVLLTTLKKVGQVRAVDDPAPALS